MGQNEQKQSFGRRMLIFLVSIFAVIGLLSMFLCAINPYISPDYFVWTSFFGLAYWPILFFNLLILLVLILLKSKKTWLYTIMALVIAIPGFLKSFSVKKELIEDGNIKIMSYNTAHFNDITDKQRNSNSVKAEVIEIINGLNPDIVCFQECGGFSKKALASFSDKINCKYYVNELSGILVLSKYPLEDDSFTEKFNDACTFGTVKLVNAGGLGKFYVECVHLKSYCLTNDEIEYIHDAKHYIDDSDTKGKSLISKLKYGFKERTEDTKFIMENMPENGLPIIVCGDFNDTPMSYTYHQMRKAGMSDAFLQVGHGFGKTYCGELPLLRIDYFWHSENIIPMTFTRLKKKLSDHYPIIMTFNVTH